MHDRLEEIELAWNDSTNSWVDTDDMQWLIDEVKRLRDLVDMMNDTAAEREKLRVATWDEVKRLREKIEWLRNATIQMDGMHVDITLDDIKIKGILKTMKSYEA